MSDQFSLVRTLSCARETFEPLYRTAVLLRDARSDGAIEQARIHLDRLSSHLTSRLDGQRPNAAGQWRPDPVGNTPSTSRCGRHWRRGQRGQVIQPCRYNGSPTARLPIGTRSPAFTRYGSGHGAERSAPCTALPPLCLLVVRCIQPEGGKQPGEKGAILMPQDGHHLHHQHNSREAQLLAMLHVGVFGLTRAEHAALKKVPIGGDLNDYLTTNELRFQARAMQVCRQLHVTRNSHGFRALADDALDAAKQVRGELLAYEQETGKRVVTADNSFIERGLPFPADLPNIVLQ